MLCIARPSRRQGRAKRGLRFRADCRHTHPVSRSYVADRPPRFCLITWECSQITTPQETIRQLWRQAVSLRDQASLALGAGAHAPGAEIFGGVLVRELVPHGYKGLARGAGKLAQRTSRANLNARWLQSGRALLSQSEATVREVSLRTRLLPSHGNSSRLLAKFNRVRRSTNALSFLSSLAVVLEELSLSDLLWNRDIPAELERRREEVEHGRAAKAELRAAASNYVRLAATVDLYNRMAISSNLRSYPATEQSVLGALDRLATGGPDAERHALISCRSAIENLCIQLGGNGDWRTSLKIVFPSDSDNRAVSAVVNFIGSKVHGGHTPSRAEADQGLRLTIATLESISDRATVS
jgi:hypothetical protein